MSATICPTDLADEITHMSRRELNRMLKQMRCSFELDFTPEYLASLSIERLRHIVRAASFHQTAAARA